MNHRPHRSVCVLTHSFLTHDGSSLQIGGVQTYVGALSEVLVQQGFSVVVLQPSSVSFSKSIGSQVTVIGVPGPPSHLRKAYLRDHCGRYGFTIFAVFRLAAWNVGEPCIAIQHGVSWDGFSTRHTGLPAVAHRFFRRFQNWRERKDIVRILRSVNHVICVDLNFPNWLRAAFPFSRWEEKLTYIPNFGDPITRDQLAVKLSRPGEPRVLIARRFETFRGTLFLAGIVKDVAPLFPGVLFEFAGSGTDERAIRAALSGIPNCKVLQIAYSEIPQANMDCDISVVPTLWSEGTSLSCIEAMCAGNAVLATNVGGLSNLILNEFNGLLVEPTGNRVRYGLTRLLTDEPLRRNLANRAHMTAVHCFSRERWKSQIIDVISRLT